jgi:tetratricopeptide (TPR) repeat protein
MGGKIFINYRRDDSIGMAGRLHDRLAQTFGRAKLFMDVDHIPAGTDFVVHLNSQVAECDVILVVIGPNWLGVKDESGGRRLDNPDDFVAIEIAAALARDIRVIPVLVDGAHMPKASELPDSLKALARRHAVDVRHTHFGHDAEALVAKMREALGDDAAGPRRWRVRAAIGAAAVAVLLLIGWGGYALIQHMLTTVEQTVQQRVATVKAEEEHQAEATAEAEAKRKSEEAEQQRVAAAKAEEERQARAAAELEATRKNTEAAQRQPAVVNSEEARRGAWLGVNIQRVTDEIAESLNIRPARGALVASVAEEGPAKAGGIDAADVIVKFDGKDIKEVRDLPRIVADTPIGKEVQVTIIRNGAEYTKTVKIGVLTAEAEEKRKADQEARARYSALVSQGTTDTNAGDHDRAIAAYSEAIRLDPNNAVAFTARGVGYMRKGDNDRAIADYNEALRLNPTFALAFANRGVAFSKKGDNDRAIADSNEAIQLNPTYSPVFVTRGIAYGKKGDNDRAIEDFNEAIRLDPKNALAFSNRGIAYLNKGDNDRSIVDLSEVIRLDPKNAIAFNNRGIGYLRKGDYDQAIADCNEALRLTPTLAPVFSTRGDAYSKKGDYDRAIADYNEAIRLNPEDALAFCKRGSAKLKINDQSGNADIAKAKQLNALVCR